MFAVQGKGQIMNKSDANTGAKRALTSGRVLKLALLASIAGCALGQGSLTASATDIAVPRMYAKAPPMAVSPVYDWSGFYAGVHAGYDWGRARVVDNGVLTESGVPMNGAAGGLLAGYNWQTGVFVLGLEADVAAAALRGHGTSAPPPPPPPAPPIVVPNEYNVNFTSNVRGRVGVAVLPQTLIYAAGGLAIAEFKFREGNSPNRFSETLTGWTIGACVDQVLAKNFIGRVEYLYADYGNKNFTVAPGDTYNIGFKTQTLRGALIAKFDAR
jgi:outer membrane immunogenic protein